MGKRNAIIEYFKGQNGKWYFRKKAANGKIASPSQGYANSSNARRAAKKLFPGLALIRIEKT